MLRTNAKKVAICSINDTDTDVLSSFKALQSLLISRKCAVKWAPYSPDHTPSDFFLWGYLKGNVYKNDPQSIQDLKAAICEQVSQIPRAMCERVIQNFEKRVRACFANNGAHIEQRL